MVQARMGSTRLPNKVLMELEGKSILEHAINRISAAEHIDEAVIVTTIEKRDLAIVGKCAELGIRVFCGSENDVLDRFYQAAKLLKPDHVVRALCDCPLADPKVVDKIIETHLEAGVDYTSNTIKPTYPDGIDLEVFTFNALKTAWKEAKLSSEREHVTPYIYKHPEKFKLLNVEHEKDVSKKRWTVDEEKDYEFVKQIYKCLYPGNNLFGIELVLKFLEDHPELEKINQGFERNEGYAKSLNEDKEVKTEGEE